MKAAHNRVQHGLDRRNPASRSERLLLKATEVAATLGVSKNHVWKLHAMGRLGPLPLRLGRSVRWRRQELEEWIAADCPPRDKWLATRERCRKRPEKSGILYS